MGKFLYHLRKPFFDWSLKTPEICGSTASSENFDYLELYIFLYKKPERNSLFTISVSKFTFWNYLVQMSENWRSHEYRIDVTCIYREKSRSFLIGLIKWENSGGISKTANLDEAFRVDWVKLLGHLLDQAEVEQLLVLLTRSILFNSIFFQVNFNSLGARNFLGREISRMTIFNDGQF